MDGRQFDYWTRRPACGASRRRVLRGLAAGAGGLVALLGGRAAARDDGEDGGNACARFCQRAFPPGPERARCVSQGARGRGPCAACGADIRRFCNGVCVDLDTDANNCGRCGRTCDDRNACTTDRCVQGQCENRPTVTCTAPPDECHAPGVCNPATGRCEFAPLHGTPCETGNRCTADTCVAGVCTEGPLNVVCAPPDPCFAPGVCNPATGRCDYAPLPEGAPCDDATLCNGAEACDGAGRCRAGVPVSCPQCQACDPATGQCLPDPGQDGQSCDDGDPCTVEDTCRAGACTPGRPKDCDDNNECTVDACDPATGACRHLLLTGTPCETGNRCTADVCRDGACTEGPAAVTCPQCQLCDPARGVCVNATDGAPCEDGNLCTVGDTCRAGTCRPGATRTCDPTGNPCTVATCNPRTGACDVQNRPDGIACNDNNFCTDNDVCRAGVCAGTPRPRAGEPCAPNRDCCGDGSVCTAAAICRIGGCIACSQSAPTPLQCDPNRLCFGSVCTPERICQIPGTPCRFGAACCCSGICTNGLCT